MNTRSDVCPGCLECEGEDHHWAQYLEEADENPDHPAAQAGLVIWEVCKHCDAWRDPEDGEDADDVDDYIDDGEEDVQDLRPGVWWLWNATVGLLDGHPAIVEVTAKGDQYEIDVMFTDEEFKTLLSRLTIYRDNSELARCADGYGPRGVEAMLADTIAEAMGWTGAGDRP